jgi:excisionase family DNA binding protein
MSDTDTYTTKEAAVILGIHDSRVRQLLIQSHKEDKRPVGRVHGNAWLLTQEDVNRLQKRVDGRKRPVVKSV